MTDRPVPPFRFAAAVPLPPYSYVPGHGLPHPVNDPAGHLHGVRDSPLAAFALAALPSEPRSRRRAIADLLTNEPRWLYALDLFNGGYYWEAHEAWEGFWHALGRTSPEAQVIQGLIHLAAAGVKIREGKPAGVIRHAKRGRELVNSAGAFDPAAGEPDPAATLRLTRESITAVLDELENHRPECWQTARFPVVKVLVSGLVPGPPDANQALPGRFS